MPDELAWQYTNRVGFEGIVSSHSVWATSIGSLNDPSELEFGVADLQDYWREIRSRLVDTAPIAEMDAWLATTITKLRSMEAFVVCACTNDDSLAHWRSYIGEDQTQGFAIGFECRAEWRVYSPASVEALYHPDFVPAFFWTDVTYGSRTHWSFDNNYWDPYKRLVDDSLSALHAIRAGTVRDIQALRDTMTRSLTIAVLTSKNAAYVSESERRLVVIGAPGLSRERPGRFGVQKYLPMVGVDLDAPIDEYSTLTISPLPIKEVLTGPWNSRADIEWATEVLRSNGYAAPVGASRVPVR